MAKSSFVLKALKILGLDEVLKLSEVLRLKQAPLKKVVGEDFISFGNKEDDQPKKPVASEANILPFANKAYVREGEKPPHEGERQQEEQTTLINSDLVLWQRELCRQIGNSVPMVDAVKGYKRFNEMYVVKDSSLDKTDKMRLASTKGVLVNKKTG